MDDLSHRPRARRIALLTLLTCAAPALAADDQAQNRASIRSLIQQEVDQTQEAAKVATAKVSEQSTLVAPIAEASRAEGRIAEGPSAATRIDVAPRNRATIIKKKTQFITGRDPIANYVDPFVPTQPPAKLSSLIRQHADPIVVPRDSHVIVRQESESAFPQVARIPAGEDRKVANLIPPAAPIEVQQSPRMLAKESMLAKEPDKEATKVSADPAAQLAAREAPQITLPMPLPLEPAELPRQVDPVESEGVAKTELQNRTPKSNLKPLLIEAQPKIHSLAEEPPTDTTESVSTPIVQEPASSKSPVVSVLGPAAPNTIDPPIRSKQVDTRSPIATAQVIRLRESARLSLRKSHQRLQRRATHSAKSYANESLRTIVAMQDADLGGNRHGVMLGNALTAIRESRDFSVQLGASDTRILQRMVAVHQTQVLKERELASLSATEATEAYLSYARHRLVQAARGAAEAAGALTILGRVERETAAPEDAHALAVAMTMQQAAVLIAPNSMLAHRELGITLSRQGLTDYAADSLRTSVSIRPTRIGYQQLLEVSRRRGDIDTAHACVEALKSGKLSSEIPVRTIAPRKFANTYRPATTSVKKQNPVSKPKSSRPKSTQTMRVSFRSIFPFGGK